MLVSTFVQNVKRKTQVGDVNVTTDQITTDIISFLNDRMFQVWRMWPWNWLWVPITINTTIGTTDYTLPSNVGEIMALTAGVGGALKPLSLKRYYDWFLNNKVDPVTGLATVPANGDVTHYVKIGRDANNNLMLRLWRPPATAITITGFGKQRITKAAVADIAAGNAIVYFPDEVAPILEEGVQADIYEEMGKKDLSMAEEQEFNARIEEIKADQMTGEDDNGETPPPDAWLFKARRRGGVNVL